VTSNPSASHTGSLVPSEHGAGSGQSGSAGAIRRSTTFLLGSGVAPTEVS
jgi:hypothetical protein